MHKYLKEDRKSVMHICGESIPDGRNTNCKGYWDRSMPCRFEEQNLGQLLEWNKWGQKVTNWTYSDSSQYLLTIKKILNKDLISNTIYNKCFWKDPIWINSYGDSNGPNPIYPSSFMCVVIIIASTDKQKLHWESEE